MGCYRGISPINIRPYKYLLIQKNEIEKMIDEMLSIWVIRNNTSLYFSPILVENKFHILIIEEKLDELHVSKNYKI